MRERPASVFGPVDLPPWKRQRALPSSALTWQQPPARVLAPQRRRPLRRLGDGWLDTNVMIALLPKSTGGKAGWRHTLWALFGCGPVYFAGTIERLRRLRAAKF